jgi:hypothetical protein
LLGSSAHVRVIDQSGYAPARVHPYVRAGRPCAPRLHARLARTWACPVRPRMARGRTYVVAVLSKTFDTGRRRSTVPYPCASRLRPAGGPGGAVVDRHGPGGRRGNLLRWSRRAYRTRTSPLYSYRAAESDTARAAAGGAVRWGEDERLPRPARPQRFRRGAAGRAWRAARGGAVDWCLVVVLAAVRTAARRREAMIT